MRSFAKNLLLVVMHYAIAIFVLLTVVVLWLHFNDAKMLLNITVLKNRTSVATGNGEVIHVNIMTNTTSDVHFNGAILHFDNGMLVGIEECQKETENGND